MNVYKDQDMYVVEVSKEDAKTMADQLQGGIVENSTRFERSERMGSIIQRYMDLHGDWK